MSWAAIATKPAQKPQVTPLRADSTVDVAVLDANAIISGEGLLLLSKLANRAITTPEVLAEVRDKKSRATLEALPYKIEQLEPAPEDIKAVMRFAQATGDAHSLSRADIRLIALTRTLEVARHGSAHLKTEPPPLVSSSRRPRAPPVHGKLPGWGDTSETWSELERINAEEEAAEKALLAAAKAAGRAADAGAARQEADVSGSRIASQMQALVLDDAAVEAVGAEGLRGAQAGMAPGPSGAEGPSSVPAPRQPVAAASPAEEAQPEAEPSSAPAGDADEEGWKQSSNSKKSRQKKAKEAEAAAALAAAERKREARRRRAASRRARKAEEAAATGAQAGAEADAAAGADSEEEATSMSAPAAEPTTADVEDAEVEGAEQAPGAEAALDQQQESEEEVEDVERHLDEEAPGAEGPSAQTSSVCILTGDFAMQNVIVQMGLRLVTKDNQRITRLSQWVLRCTACYAVSKEIGRIFCPKCGNASMSRVRLTVGPDGAEQYGVRTKHNLRGTRFSLPKPKGGRSEDVILTEDVFMKRAAAARRNQGRRKDEVDPFSAEFNQDTWHQGASLRAVSYQGAAALLAGWKNNPNERKHRATNRRRK